MGMLERKAKQFPESAEAKAAEQNPDNHAEVERHAGQEETIAPGNYNALKLIHTEAGVSQQQEASAARDEDKNAVQQAENGGKELSDRQQAQQDNTARFREMMDESQSQEISRSNEGRE